MFPTSPETATQPLVGTLAGGDDKHPRLVHSPPPPTPAAAYRTMSYPPPPRKARAPTMTHHNKSLSLILPTPEILGSVAGGAHYAGALSPHDKHVHPPYVGKHQRSFSLSVDDPMLEKVYRAVMQDLQELFCGRPTLEIFERRWRRDAEFEDPFCKCVGFGEYAPKFFALRKVCSRSERISARVLSATLKPNRLVYAQTQEYTLRFFGSKKTISSFVLVDLDENFKIIRLVDQWNGEGPPTWWGALFLRKLNAKLVPWLVHVPKSPGNSTASAA